MSLFKQLYKTFEYYEGKNLPSDERLTPIAHMLANAQIEVTLNAGGQFLRAHIIEKKDAATLIPVTESSAGRASGIAPHALSDTLSYIAGDFSLYCTTAKQVKVAEEKFKAYMQNLEKWVQSEYTHPKVQAIYKYLLGRRMALDLAGAGILCIKEDKFADDKINGLDYEKLITRFQVLGESGKDGTWEDAGLIQAFIQYYLNSKQEKTDICYITGTENMVSNNHPKGIVPSDYGAKLISANDKQGFTYRGRFREAGEAFALSYDASQKIHHALAWLVKTQGVPIGSKSKRTFICWNPEGKKLPDLFFPDVDEDEEMQDTVISYKEKLKKMLHGYQEQFRSEDEVIIMGLEAATTGRLSVTYYNELAASDFLARIAFWGRSCNWAFLKFNEKKQPYYTVATPPLYKAVECAFGHEQGNFIEVDDRIMKEQLQRLVKCMLDKEPLPYYFVRALTVRASMPMAYSRGNRERVLSTACAFIKKFYYQENDGYMEEEDMRLDLGNSDRSYLFGRLLAVYEFVEQVTYEKGEARDPNAIRLQSSFAKHPMQGWKILEETVRPYYQKLNPGAREYYRNMISEITGSFKEESIGEMNKALEETYLLGYYLQRAELRKKKKDEQEEGKDEPSTEQN